VLDCVRRAERLLAEESLDKEYTGITGVPAFTEASVRLLLGERSEVVAKGLYGCAQTLSGTGGLRVGAEFLKKYHAYEKVPSLSYLSTQMSIVF
jgi:aspartate aminotransferase